MWYHQDWNTKKELFVQEYLMWFANINDHEIRNLVRMNIHKDHKKLLTQ